MARRLQVLKPGVGSDLLLDQMTYQLHNKEGLSQCPTSCQIGRLPHCILYTVLIRQIP